MPINDKDRAFADHYLENGDALAAYKSAFSAKRSKEVLTGRARRKLEQADVQEYLRAAQGQLPGDDASAELEETAAKGVDDVDGLVAKLERIADANPDNQTGLRALDLIAKHRGIGAYKVEEPRDSVAGYLAMFTKEGLAELDREITLMLEERARDGDPVAAEAIRNDQPPDE